MAIKKITRSIKPRNDLTAEFVRSILVYNSTDGIFTWKARSDTKDRAAKAWNGKPAGGKSNNKYISIKINGVLYKAHRLAWLYMTGEWPKYEIDHINGEPGDNRINNLREAKRTENSYNRGAQKDNTSGHKGVSFYKPYKKWRATIAADGKWRHLGYFESIEDAKAAYAKASSYLHKDFRKI
ncbi:MAG: HNH endonuclease [Patescibacteria group bacterium]|nr:HNH endonuclease [Patescibacteria group bacterium]